MGRKVHRRVSFGDDCSIKGTAKEAEMRTRRYHGLCVRWARFGTFWTLCCGGLARDGSSRNPGTKAMHEIKDCLPDVEAKKYFT